MSYQAETIPNELKKLPQWVCSGTDKIPINPLTGHRADPMNPSTWATFEDACNSGKPHIGFCLHQHDPYCIIDLDDKVDNPATEEQRTRFAAIMNSIDSYTEISQSGTGIHIVCKGSVPSGVKRDNVEVYSWGRYMIFTGNVLKQAPITDASPIIDRMFAEMKSDNGLTELEWVDPILTDLEVHSMGCSAVNADKFSDLWNGQWQHYSEYNTEGQSAADYALLAMLCFYTRSNEQVMRMFRTSALGQRKKAERDDYLIRSIRRIRSVQSQPQIDFTNLKIPVALPITPQAPVSIVESTPVSTSNQLTFPPGLVGEIAQYIYQSSNRPVPHVSLAAAIALVAGICGRAYNISAQGLNHYIILVAGTGRGKEDAARGIDRLMSSVRAIVPTADRFEGPGTFASGQGLIRCLDESPCFVSVMGEVGITLQKITRKDANPADVAFKIALLDLYSKSGFQSTLKPSAYSDREKNTKLIQAPNVTILGEGSTATFFKSMEIDNIADGLIPRFTILHYDGERVPRNKTAFAPPHSSLVDSLAMLCSVALATEQGNSCAPVASAGGATTLLDAFDVKCDGLINGASNAAEAELWNRAHLKALKLSALIAVGCDPHNPIVTEVIAQWSIDFTEAEVGAMSEKFSSGEIGEGDHRQEQDLRRAIAEYYKMKPAKRKNNNVPQQLCEHGNIFPLSYIKRRLRLLSSFKNDRRGAHVAIEALLKTLVSDGTLERVPTNQAFEQFGTRAAIYILGDSWGSVE